MISLFRQTGKACTSGYTVTSSGCSQNNGKHPNHSMMITLKDVFASHPPVGAGAQGSGAAESNVDRTQSHGVTVLQRKVTQSVYAKPLANGPTVLNVDEMNVDKNPMNPPHLNDVEITVPHLNDADVDT